jgi:hypothetical protein
MVGSAIQYPHQLGPTSQEPAGDLVMGLTLTAKSASVLCSGKGRVSSILDALQCGEYFFSSAPSPPDRSILEEAYPNLGVAQFLA